MNDHASFLVGGDGLEGGPIYMVGAERPGRVGADRCSLDAAEPEARALEAGADGARVWPSGNRAGQTISPSSRWGGGY